MKEVSRRQGQGWLRLNLRSTTYLSSVKTREYSFIRSLSFKLILHVIKAFFCLQGEHRGLHGPRFLGSEIQTHCGLLKQHKAGDCGRVKAGMLRVLLRQKAHEKASPSSFLIDTCKNL